MPFDQLPNSYFDIIYIDQVLERVTSFGSILSILPNKLKPGGLLKISVPNARHYLSAIRCFDLNLPYNAKDNLHFVAPLEHINFFAERSLQSLLSCCSLRRYNLNFFESLSYLDFSSPITAIKSLLRPIDRFIEDGKNYMLAVKT